MSTEANETPLRPNQKRALSALLDGLSKQQAAVAAGVQPATLSRWMSEDNFRNHLTEVSTRRLADASVRLKANLGTAIDTFREGMSEPNSMTIRLSAANYVMVHATRLAEVVDLFERVEALEERLQ